MGRPPCCDKANVKRGLWTAEEDAKILAYVSNHGIGNWTQVPKKAGLNRCGKSCRLRWTNYLRPDLKHEEFTEQEEELIIQFHAAIGSRWSLIAKRLPGRTDNDVKNYWNTKLKKKLTKLGIDPVTHKPFAKIISDFESISCLTTTYQMRSLDTLTNSLSSQCRISPSIQSGIHSTDMGRITMLDHFQDGYSSSNNYSMNQESFNHYMLDELSPSSSSSSSSSISNGNSNTLLLTSQASTALVMPASHNWDEKSIAGPLQTTDIKEEEQNIQGFLAPDLPDKSVQCELADAKHLNSVTDDNCGMAESKGAAGNAERSSCNEPSSSVSSFVKALLDRDSEMQLNFPVFGDILDY